MVAVPLVRLSPLAKARLVLEILSAYGRAQRRLRRDELPAVIAWARAPAAEAGDRAVDRVEALRLGRAVDKTLRRLPTDHRCLIQSVVLCGLLARRGVHGTLVIGVRPGGAFGAHAWVELDAVPLIPAMEDEFARLTEL